MGNPDATASRQRAGFAQQVRAAKRPNLDHLDRISYWLDDLIQIPLLNLRIGMDPILGVVPWLGDTVAAILSLYLIGIAVYHRVPKVILMRMAINVGFDYLIGIIPFIGDAADIFVKSNRWNMDLLRKYAQERRPPGLFDILFVVVVIGTLALLIVGGIASLFYLLKAIGHLW